MCEPRITQVSDLEPDFERMAECECSFRRGVTHALNLAGDLVRAGATADDLDILTDIAMDWRNHARPDVHVPEDLVRLWHRGERGVTGLDLSALQECDRERLPEATDAAGGQG